WRRSGGAAPAIVKMDGVDVMANTTTVGDPSVNFAASVIQLPSPLTYMSYHVFQGTYADGKIAGAGVRAWSHQFMHATWYTFNVSDGDMVGAQAFIDDALNHGINAVENQMPGGIRDYLSSSAGKAYAESKGYGAIVWNQD